MTSSTPTEAPEAIEATQAAETRSASPEHTLSEVFVALVALAISVFIAITTELMPVGLLPTMAESFGRSITQAGIIVTVYAGMVAVFSVPLTIWTARFERKQVLLATLITFTASSIIVATAPHFAVLAVGRALGGAAHALFFAVALGYPARLLRPQDLGRGMAILTSGVSIGFVAGVPAATALGVQFGWRAAFAAVSVVAVILIVVVWKLLPAVPNTAPAAIVSRPSAEGGWWRRMSPFIAVQTVNFLVYGSHYVAYTYINPLLRAAGFSEEGVAPMLLVLGGVGIIGLFLTGLFLDRFPRRALFLTLLGFLVGLVGLGLGLEVWMVAIPSVILWNIAFGAAPTYFSTASMRTAVVSPDMSGAWINSSSNVGIALGAILGGAVLDSRGLAAVPLVAAALFGVAILVVWRAKAGFPAAVPVAPPVSLDLSERQDGAGSRQYRR